MSTAATMTRTDTASDPLDRFWGDDLATADPAVAEAIRHELDRQRNRIAGARCALVSEPLSAALSREHNDANVIALGARLTGIDMAKACVEAFLATDFAGGRHQRRVDQLSQLLQESD